MNNVLYIFLASGILFSCQPRFEAEITTEELRDHIGYLASDELKGRYPGTPEDKILTRYIADELGTAGVELYGKNGLQPFEIVTDIEAGPGNHLIIGERELRLGTDYTPVTFSASGSVNAELVFAGYGFQVDEADQQWNDYEPVDVTGKWVMVLRGVPGAQDGTSPYVNYSEDRGKALIAADHDAAGVILVSGESYDEADGLEELGGNQHRLPIPVVQLTRAAADMLLQSAGSEGIAALESGITDKLQPASFATGVTVDITVDLQPDVMETANVFGVLEGDDPSLSSQYVVIGAHHDHLGMGGEGSSSRTDTLGVHHGADDNASGVAGVLEIAERLAADTPSRSMVFATFGAEEMGLVGSRYFTENAPFDLAAVQAMINLDMVGRLNDERQLQVGGVGTSPGLQELLDSLNRDYGFDLKYSNEGYGPSDHAAFYAQDVPVIYVSTGAHSDYHTPGDQLSKINLEGARDVMRYVADIALVLANKHEKLAFTEAGPKVQASSRSSRGGITLGLMPDVTYDGNEGMPVMFVTEGKPAAVAGIQKGDIIVAIEGKSVGNVYDYMSRLDQLKEGMSVVVTVKRGEDRMELLVRI